MSDIFWCSNCLNASTRPRISFDNFGKCNACVWSERKKNLDWKNRQSELESLLSLHRNPMKFDCLVPVSGGKDGSYVAHTLKEKFQMNPLCVTVTPALPLPLGDENLRNFINSGFNHIKISPNPSVMRKLNKNGLIYMGFPYYAWLTAINASILNIAKQFEIELIFYGEDGEVEYGGTNATENKPFYDVSYMTKIYLEGGHNFLFAGLDVPESEKYWYNFPQDIPNLKIAHWSYFENWDPYRNYLIAKEYCGLTENNVTNSGTFTNFAQNDQALYALHTYFMYLKFGFGRATQDVGIEIRRGAMTRDQGLRLVRLYDGQFPNEFLETYLDYFDFTYDQFIAVANKFTNQNLFDISDDKFPKPKFEVQ